MKKLLDFKNAELIQSYADKRFDGNFSLAVTSVMDAVSKSAIEYCVGAENKGDYCDSLGIGDVFSIGQFVGSDLASMIGLPPRTIDMLMRGIDSTLIAQEFDSMDVDTREQAVNCILNVSTSTNHGDRLKTDYSALACSIYQNEIELKDQKSGGRNSIENRYKQKIANNFKCFFPLYSIVGTEVQVSDSRDRIDILAVCDQTGSDVIIELKVKNKAAHKQLRSYAAGFDNPILISITESYPEIACDGVIYKTYNELGVELGDD